MIASACLTMALVHVLVWWRQREVRANGLFALTAVTAVIFSAGEIWMMRAGTVEEYGRAVWWTHIPVFIMLVSLVGFVRVYLQAGRLWLAWAIFGTRALTVIVNFFSTPNINYRDITGLHHIHFLGETVAIAEGVTNSWILVSHAGLLLLVAFVVDATFTVWRRGDRWGARLLSGAITFFVLMGSGQAILFFWGKVQMPLIPSLFFSAIVIAMGFELSWDVIRAAKLAENLRESEARFRTILEQAPLGISISRNEANLYANKQFRELFGLQDTGQWVGGSLLEYFAPQCREEIKERIRHRSLGLSVPKEYESVGLRPDGTQFPMQLTVAPIHLADGDANMSFVEDITERKQAEAALRQSESKYRKIFENVQEVFYQVDNSGKIIEISPSIERYSGYRREELIGKPVEDVYYNKDDRAGLLKAIYEKGEVADYELRVKTKSGRLVYASVNAHVLFDTEGKPVGLEGALRDVTEHKRVEAALEHERTLLRTLIDLVPEFIFVKDTDSRFLLVNQSLAKSYGRLPAEMLRHSDADFMVPELAARCRASELKVLAADSVCVFEDTFTLPDGQARTISTNMVAFRDSHGQVAGLVGIGRDITDQKQVEASHARLATVVEQSSESIIITDTEGTIVYVNPAFEKTTGYSRVEAIGQNPRLLKSNWQNDEFYRQLWGVLASGETWRGRLTNRHKNGTLYEEDAAISPVRDIEGKIINYVGVKRDVTREVQLETELRQSQKLEAIGQLAGGVAHDFNNILASILMQVDLVKMEENLAPAVAESLQQVRADAERAANLTRQLLLFSRRQTMQPRILNLNEQVINLVKMLQRIIGEDVHLELHLHPTPLLIHADAGMVDQVLMNLVVNARDAMPEGGRLRIETAEKTIAVNEPLPHPEAVPGHFVCLTVSDTGDGIPPEVLPRIFEPFFTTKTAGKGTGLGLATVYGIVKQHQGWVQLDNRPGQGVTFHIMLPASAAAAEKAPNNTKFQARGGTETILLVEDEPGLLTLTSKILERHGYRVLAAANGPAALDLWQEQRANVALLLTDLVMPGGLSGRELARRLQAEQPQLKVVYTSGYSADIAGREFQLCPGESFIQKPVAIKELIKLVRECLDR